MKKNWIVSEKYNGEERREKNGNGFSRLTWWIMVTAVGVVLAGGMGWMTSINAEVRHISTIMASRGERISSLEEAVLSIRQDLGYIRSRLDLALDVIRKSAR